ncbi:hypothetical protein [Actinoplanes derwentensis]|uniref:Glycosyl hydrolase catalytic core n=1 Tax=Actinoplanes derwentensis TaxID=113562 RepID=A0A1H1UP92_9ACTN|nr:hypothetical protein [Actinoplanes derwentensis]GID88124.1 hypothetical protein Ade03nite_70480 [Actinoplanes derwentensis]SDS74283.1 hypothetical protein SAMN04489716_1501 [Actinoplanes derwentensis]
MRFGIYIGSRAGATCADPADPLRIGPLIDDLSGGQPFVIREYVRWCGGNTALEQQIGASGDLDHLTMPDDWYVTGGRELDLVLSYLPPVADLDGWLAFIDRALDRYGHLVRYLQVTLEPNFPIPHIDGSSPGVLAALTEGLPHARTRVSEGVQVGFSLAEPAEWLGGDDDFWRSLNAIPYADFAAHVDYVGLGLYPDGFSPHDDVHGATLHALGHLRHRLAEAHFPTGLPIHIAEAGSPSGAHRTPTGQVSSLTALIDASAAAGAAQFELFALSDADSAADSPLGTFGLCTGGYLPKPAYETYRSQIKAAPHQQRSRP